MNQIQGELAALQPPAQAQILGINLPGLATDNAWFCDGKTLPWLQDTAAEDVWSRWHVTWRDVVILDRQNQPIQVYNLSVHDLSIATDRAELKNLLIAAASPP